MRGTPDATRVEARPREAGGVRDDIVHASCTVRVVYYQ
jgi:hypothetical protein